MADILTQQFLVETWISVGNKIDVLWNMFIAIHFAVFGYIFTVNHGRKIHFIEKIIGLIAYSVFIYINANALISSYDFLQALTIQYQETFLKTANLTSTLHDYIAKLDYSQKHYLPFTTHGFGMIVVFLSMGFADKYLNKSKQKTSSSEQAQT